MTPFIQKSYNQNEHGETVTSYHREPLRHPKGPQTMTPLLHAEAVQCLACLGTGTRRTKWNDKRPLVSCQPCSGRGYTIRDKSAFDGLPMEGRELRSKV